MFADCNLDVFIFFTILSHLALARRIQISNVQHDGKADADLQRPASALVGAHPGNLYTEPDAGYVRLRIFRFERRINQYTSKAENSNLGDLAFVCSNLWDVKGPGQLGFWRFGSMMSVYHVDVKLKDELGPYLLCNGGKCGGDRRNPRVDPAEHNEFGLSVRGGDNLTTLTQTGCTDGDPALRKMKQGFRWYSLKTANTRGHPEETVDPLAEWKSVKYVGTLDLRSIFPEDSFEEILTPSVSTASILEKPLDVIYQRIDAALTQETYGYGRAHERWKGERCSDKWENGNAFGLHSCQKSWRKGGRCAWVDSEMCVPNCLHKDNWQHPALCLSIGPCKWDGETCSFDSEKVWTIEAAACRDGANLTETQQTFCSSLSH